MTALDFYRYKAEKKKISMVTCYDYSMARILSQTPVTCLLVGDTLAMTMLGFKDTLSATVETMALHIAAVRRGAGKKFIIGDLPFLSYRKSLSESMSAAEKLVQAGAQALKLEGASGNLALIKHLTESGVPIIGHVGLTPQHVHALGGYKKQGKTQECAVRLKEDALLLQEAGCFAVVLECIPAQLGKEITELLSIATIGIGAGSFTDGQVLVLQDLLGLNIDFQPQFAKSFVDGASLVTQGINSYVRAVELGEFPVHEDSN